MGRDDILDHYWLK